MPEIVMPPPPVPKEKWEAKTLDFFRRAQILLKEAGVPFLIGGAFALDFYTGIWRATKDLDVFVRPEDFPRVLDFFASQGYETELTFPHWLGKVFSDGDLIDIIFGSGNGVARVDDHWFEHAPEGDVLGVRVRLCPAEEMIWSKAYIMERERFDGADVAHLLRARAGQLDWPRLLKRFGPHWEVLFCHLLLFRFIYPADRDQIPPWVLQDLLDKVQRSMQVPAAGGLRFRGTLISREQYLVDLKRWGYPDARLQPTGNMTGEEIAIWTDAIGK
jgi:hypothetical protein